MTVRIIGAGFGRTGTMSVKAALEQLGFGPCYHAIELFKHPWHAPVWEVAIRGEPVDWRRVLARYQSTVDWPGAACYEQLMAAYPHAKILLTVRNPQQWYDSARATIYPTNEVFRSPRGCVLRLLRPHASRTLGLIWERTFAGRFPDRAYAIDVFNQHVEQVKARVPADRLLVYDVRDGWGPLCAFLGVEAPRGVAFPHLNDSASFHARIRQRIVTRWRLALGLGGLGLAVTAAARRRPSGGTGGRR
jgi:hypothetical protein